MTAVPDLIRARLAELDQTDEAAARVMGVSTSTVNRWKKGNLPRRANRAALAEWLGIPGRQLREAIAEDEEADDDLVSQVAELAQALHAGLAELELLRAEVEQLRRQAAEPVAAGRQRRP
jgi:transcriptional regulator with XRE-family HTH domain